MPLQGVTIRVDGIPEASAITDAEGRFELLDMPAPEFFVHIDGSTVPNPPQGMEYPIVGNPVHSIPGESVNLNHNGVEFDIFLPPMDLGDVIDLSDTEMTEVGFGDGGKAELANMFPELDPATWDLFKVSFPPGSAVDRSGAPATQASIIPVPPDRTPSPIPGGMNPSLVVSIQAPGASEFDVPAPITFPNIDGLEPGTSSFLSSFDHDVGEFVVIGTGTVSEDGSVINSDPGTGIVKPGWHIVFCVVTAVKSELPNDDYGNGIFWGTPDIKGLKRYYDFGTSFSPLSLGYMRVTPQSLYTPEIGYGWSTGLVGGVSRGSLLDIDSMYDFNETLDGTFSIDVEPGCYDISIALGDVSQMRTHMGIWIEGMRMGNVSSDADILNCIVTNINTVVMDGRLDINLWSAGQDRVAISSLMVNQVKEGFMPGELDIVNGTFYRARENVHLETVVRDVLSIANVEVLFQDFMDPYTHYKQHVFHKESMKVGFREWVTPGKSTLIEIPTYPFGYPLPMDTDEDGLYDLIEWILGFDPENPDSDGNGITDFEEIYGVLVF